MESTDARELRLRAWREASEAAKLVLKPGDRIRASHGCRSMATFTFAGWDGHWIVSKSGINDISASSITHVNGQPQSFMLVAGA